METYCGLALSGQRSGRCRGLCVQAVGSGLCGQRLRARDESALEVATMNYDALYKLTAFTFYLLPLPNKIVVCCCCTLFCVVGWLGVTTTSGQHSTQSIQQYDATQCLSSVSIQRQLQYVTWISQQSVLQLHVHARWCWRWSGLSTG